jgi:hypothetical protein
MSRSARLVGANPVTVALTHEARPIGHHAQARSRTLEVLRVVEKFSRERSNRSRVPFLPTIPSRQGQAQVEDEVISAVNLQRTLH